MQNNYRNNYIFTCGRLPLLGKSITGVSLPTVSVSDIQYPGRSHDIAIPSNKLIHDPINIEFIVDENFDNYKEAFDWLQDIRAYTSSSIKDLMADGQLIILSNNKQPLKKIRFEGMFPTILSEIQFTTQDVSQLTCNLTMAYTQFLFV